MNSTGLNTSGYSFCGFLVPRRDITGKTKRRIIGDLNSMVDIPERKDRNNWAEKPRNLLFEISKRDEVNKICAIPPMTF